MKLNFWLAKQKRGSVLIGLPKNWYHNILLECKRKLEVVENEIHKRTHANQSS